MPKMTDEQKRARADQRDAADVFAAAIERESGYEWNGRASFTDGFRLAWLTFDSLHVSRLTVTVAVVIREAEVAEFARLFTQYTPPDAAFGRSWCIGETPLPRDRIVPWMIDLVESARVWEPLLATPPRSVTVGQYRTQIRSVPEARYAGGYEWNSDVDGIEDNADWEPRADPTRPLSRLNRADTLRQIRSAAGLPDPAEACRTIVRIVNETLGDV